MKDAMGAVRRLVSVLRKGRISGALRPVMRVRQKLRERSLRRVLKLTCQSKGPLPSVCYHGEIADLPASRVLRSCFLGVVSNGSKLPPEVSSIRGMSGQKYRTFINRVMASMPNPRYLEIGSFTGSTAAAALYGNCARAVCIDNWSQFGGPRSEFFFNLSKVCSSEIDFSVLERDFRSVDYSELGTFNVYMFDGPHAENDQYDGIVFAQPALDAVHILIIDDWNWPAVRLGTLRALRDIRCKIEYAIELRTSLNNTHPLVRGEASEWHNGYLFAVIGKAFT